MAVSKQAEKLAKLVAYRGTSPITSTEIEEASMALFGIPHALVFIKRDEANKIKRGLYRIPVKGAATAVAAAKVAPAPVAAPAAEVAVTVMSVGSNVVNLPTRDGAVVRSGSVVSAIPDDVSLVPERMDGFVPFGAFKKIAAVMKSRKFAPIFITGLSGNGKTLMIEQAAARENREYIRVNITKSTDETDLIGGKELVNGETVFQYGPVVEAMLRGAVLLLDEIDLGGEGLMSLQPVLEGKPIFIKKINKWIRPKAGFQVFATANTKGLGESDQFVYTNVLNAAFRDRFVGMVKHDYPTAAIESQILEKAGEAFGVDAESLGIIIPNLTKWASIIRKAHAESAVDEVITTRSLVNTLQLYAVFGNMLDAIELVVERYDSSVRDSFLKLWTKIDGGEDVTENSAAFDEI